VYVQDTVAEATQRRFPAPHKHRHREPRERRPETIASISGLRAGAAGGREHHARSQTQPAPASATSAHRRRAAPRDQGQPARCPLEVRASLRRSAGSRATIRSSSEPIRFADFERPRPRSPTRVPRHIAPGRLPPPTPGLNAARAGAARRRSMRGELQLLALDRRTKYQDRQALQELRGDGVGPRQGLQGWSGIRGSCHSIF
jgi:hypothetical protein